MCLSSFFIALCRRKRFLFLFLCRENSGRGTLRPLFIFFWRRRNLLVRFCRSGLTHSSALCSELSLGPACLQESMCWLPLRQAARVKEASPWPRLAVAQHAGASEGELPACGVKSSQGPVACREGSPHSPTASSAMKVMFDLHLPHSCV